MVCYDREKFTTEVILANVLFEKFPLTEVMFGELLKFFYVPRNCLMSYL